MTGITGIIAFIELVWIKMTLLKMLGNVGIKKQENARVKMLDWFTLLPVILAMIVKLKLLFYTGAKSLLYQAIHWFSKSNNTQF